MRFGRSSTCKLIFRPLKPKLLENSSQVEDLFFISLLINVRLLSHRTEFRRRQAAFSALLLTSYPSLIFRTDSTLLSYEIYDSPLRCTITVVVVAVVEPFLVMCVSGFSSGFWPCIMSLKCADTRFNMCWHRLTACVCSWMCGWEYFKVPLVCTGIFFFFFGFSKPEAKRKCVFWNPHTRAEALKSEL